MSYNDIRATEPPYPTPVSQDDYYALASKLAEAERLLVECLGWLDEDGYAPTNRGAEEISLLREQIFSAVRATDSAGESL